jgi:hypothetical protein
MRDNAESFDAFTIITDDMQMLDDGRAYWEGRVRVVGKDGGPQVLQAAYNVFEFRDGRVTAFKSFPRRGDARRAAGLPD